MYSTLPLFSDALLIFIPSNALILPYHISIWLYLIPLTGIAILIFRKAKPDLDFSVTTKNIVEPNSKEVVEFNRYAGGHPEINELILPCIIHLQPGYIEICKYVGSDQVQVSCIGRIPIDDVLEIRVEDVFTMKRKMTREAWEVSHKYVESLNDRRGSEVAFIVIEWKDKEINRFTYLCIEDEAAMETALKKRNAVVKKAKQNVLQIA
jgi:hypothetical protein